MSKKPNYLTPLPKEHPLYTMVGRVASEWSHVEHKLDTVIWMLSGTTNERAACITSQIMGIPGRCKAIITLGTLVGINEATLKKFTKIIGVAGQLVDERNRYVHDPWYMEFPAGTAAQFKAMPYSDRQYGLKPIATTDINGTIQRIKKLSATVLDARKTILSELKTLREKHAERDPR